MGDATEKKTERSDFEVMQEVADKNMDIYCCPPGNFKRAQTGKDGFGEIVMAAGNQQILNLEKYTPILYLLNTEQLVQLKSE